jgi:tetratricopeptide (TPR) repeat protein
MLKSLPKTVEKSLIFLVASFVFLVPPFFLPITSEFYELNKQALLVALLVVGYSLLVTQMLLSRKLTFIRTRFDLPILLLLAIYVGSSIFSVSLATSLLGGHGLFHGGLASLIFYIGLFYLMVNTAKLSILNLRFSIMVSALALSLFSILQYFEIYIFPWEFTHQRFWTPIGGIKTLVIYLSVIIPLIIGWLLRAKGFKKVVFCLVLFIGLIAVFLILGEGGALRNFLPEKYQTIPTEVTLDWQTSWQVANSVLAFRPLFGSGPGTFSSDFTRYKPQNFNQKTYWNVRFNHSANEWFEIVACLGIAGVIIYLGLWARIGREITRNLMLKNANFGLAISLGVFFLSLFFSPTTTATSVLFWTLLALFVIETGLIERVLFEIKATITDSKGKSRTKALSFNKILGFSFLLLASVFSYFYFFYLFRADVQYQKATVEFSQNREEAYQSALFATQLNPFSDVYQTGLTTASLGVASPLSQQALSADKQASPSASLIQKFINRAVVAGNKAIQLNPKNVRNWENLAGLYQTLLLVDPNAEQQVVNSFNQAISLDPMNPVLRSQLANFLLQRGKVERAINQLILVLGLKGDYLQAHYDLAQAYRVVGDLDKAREELRAVLVFLPQNSPQAEMVKTELKSLVLEEATPSGEPVEVGP